MGKSQSSSPKLTKAFIGYGHYQLTVSRIIDRGRIVFGKNYIPVSDSYKQIFQDFLNKRS